MLISLKEFNDAKIRNYSRWQQRTAGFTDALKDHGLDPAGFFLGTLPFDKDNNVVFIDDPKAQTRHVLETIRKVIETAGGTMADVTFNSIFITDWKNYAAINEIYAEFFPGDKPARFCIQCGLVKPDALVEIATIAHIAK